MPTHDLATGGSPTNGAARAAVAEPVTGAVALAAALRGAGMPVGPDRVQHFVEALDQLDARDRTDVYWAGRATLCAHPEHITRYDNVFAAFFEGRVADMKRVQPTPVQQTTTVALPVTDTDGSDHPDDEDQTALVANASSVEVLRRRDVASLDAEERRQLERLLARFAMPGAQRRTRRWQPDRIGAVDRGRTVRALLRSGGEIAELRWRSERHRPRRVVLLIDVSGSMTPYADALLRFAHAATRGRQRTEVFSIGTRLTRLTRELSHRDADTAMASVASAIPDWSGGTRLGTQLKAFLDRWGQRGMARGAIVVLMSDGWEREDPALLGEQMARLHRLAHRVVWANPRRARPGFEPLVGGLLAALPHVDAFVDGHSLEAYEHLADVVAGRKEATHA
ncbi:MAG TPA: VWA domain-containing protein [Euzebyales bacterium]|nr:VWA domain-containing protein [Euzebyales bacterium]